MSESVKFKLERPVAELEPMDLVFWLRDSLLSIDPDLRFSFSPDDVEDDNEVGNMISLFAGRVLCLYRHISDLCKSDKHTRIPLAGTVEFDEGLEIPDDGFETDLETMLAGDFCVASILAAFNHNYYPDDDVEVVILNCTQSGKDRLISNGCTIVDPSPTDTANNRRKIDLSHYFVITCSGIDLRSGWNYDHLRLSVINNGSSCHLELYGDSGIKVGLLKLP